MHDVDAPRAKQIPQTLIHLDDALVDNYEWLRDRDSAEVKAHLKAENDWALAKTRRLKKLQDAIFAEIKSHTQENVQSLPSRQGAYWYYTRQITGQNYPLYCRLKITRPQSLKTEDWTPPALPKDGSAPEGEEIIFDANKEAEGKKFFTLGSFDISPDGTLLLYGIDSLGEELYELRVRNLNTGKDLEDVIKKTAAGAYFLPNESAFLYQTTDKTWRPDKLFKHALGTDPKQDQLLFHEPNPGYWVGSELSASQRFVFIDSGDSESSCVRFIDLLDPKGNLKEVWPRRPRVKYSLEHAQISGLDVFLITHNHNALDYEVVVASTANPRHFHPFLPHTPGSPKDDIEAFGSFLLLSSRQDGLPSVSLARLPKTTPSGAEAAKPGRDDLNAAVKILKEIGFEKLQPNTQLAAVETGARLAWDAPLFLITLDSFTTPHATLAYVLSNNRLETIHTHPVPGYNPDLYRQERIWVRAEDGQKIPVSIVYRQDLVGSKKSPAPVWLYGYGSYGSCMDPHFSTLRLPMLDRGVIFALAHVRGGGEMGEAWYRGGKFEHKTKTFTDFITTAKALIKAGYTRSDQLVIEGRSAGGMLIGAVINLAPRLFRAALAGVPFVDVLTTMLRPDLPLTVLEYAEWGDPNDPQVYEHIKSYSPYQNIAEDAKHYPNILATTGLNDPRVSYVEPAKWVAKLRERGAEALLKLDEDSGHFGASGRYAAWKSRAFELAWLLDQLGLSQIHPSEPPVVSPPG